MTEDKTIHHTASHDRAHWQSKHQHRIEKFAQLAGHKVPTHPTELDEDTRMLRASLILEEALETIISGLGVTVLVGKKKKPLKLVKSQDKEYEFVIEPGVKMDMVEAVDGCCDISVVTIGTLSAMGVMDEPVLREVDNNNLAKFGPGSRRRADGKVLKPPNHPKPNIAGMLEAQGWKG